VRADRAELAPIGRPRERQGFAVARDGSAIYYRVHEPAEGVAERQPPVVFTDGIGCDGYVWKYLEPELTRERTVVHWHFRGHGRTPPPRDADRVTIVDSAEDLVAVLDTVGIDRAVLAGHSMGVQVCLETWRRSPERVSGLVLLCGSYGNPLRTFKGSRTLEEVLPLARLGVHMLPRMVTAFWRSVIPTDFAYQLATKLEVNGALIRREDFFPYLEHIASVDVRLFVDMLAAAGRHTAREILGDIDVPTLIVAGERDSFTPLSLSEEMHRLIPGSELLVVRDGSHTTPIERPLEVNEATLRLLERVDAAT
jgi:pimeloyl-ACP methyl ester carboxylesterase